MKADNFILTGFMGSGKSTIGKKLAGAFGYSFLDTDEVLEKKFGKSIREVFANEGEEYFRKCETELLKELLTTCTKTVVSTGGGMPMREENAALLKQLGTVVYLDVKLETILERLKNDTKRPLLQGSEYEQKTRKLYKQRLPKYRSGADFCLLTGGKSFYRIIKEAEEIRKHESAKEVLGN